MDPTDEIFPDPPKTKHQKTTDKTSPVCELRTLGTESLCQLAGVESEISQIVSAGIQDTSFLMNAEHCVELWSYIQQQHSDSVCGEQDDFGVDVRLKSLVRAFGEGSTLTLSILVPTLRNAIKLHCDIVCDDIMEHRLKTLVPIFIIRKNLGDQFSSSGGVERSECDRPECLWVWESPTQDVFPPHLLEHVKVARESRILISRRYKALIKLRTAIKSGDLQAKQIAYEQLSTISRKSLLEKEKRERNETKKRSSELKKVKREVKIAEEKKERQERSERSQKAEKTPKNDRKALLNQSNILLKWLKAPETATSTNKTATDDQATVQLTQTSEAAKKLSIVPNTFELDEVCISESQRSELQSLISQLPSCRRGTAISASNGDSLQCSSIYGTDEVDFMTICKSHQESWMRYFKFLASQRRFYVNASGNDSTSKSYLVDEVWPNLQPSGYGDISLRLEPYCRIFQMSDNEWKRPAMRLAISRSSPNVGPTTPLGLEPALDYECDSDEEWFLQYDVDDVDESGSEEETDSDGADDWIVEDDVAKDKDNCGVTSDQAISLSESIRVYCLYRNWHWIVDGVPQNAEECCSVQVALNNGINIHPCDYGFGFEGYTRNPIPDFLRSLKKNRIIMTKSDVEELLKMCHGSYAKREALISSFKEQKAFTSTSEIRKKFNKYMRREKIDDAPQRWLVTPEAAKLFGIRRQLDKILNQRIESHN